MRPIHLPLPFAVILSSAAVCSLHCKEEAAPRGGTAERVSAPSAVPVPEENPCTALRREVLPSSGAEDPQTQWVCLPEQGRAWAAYLAPVSPESGYAALRILYSGQAKADANRSIHRRDEQLPLPMLAPEAKARLSPGASYDFDNDGAQEFFVKVTLLDPQHGDVVYGFLNRFDGTRIVDHEPARGLPVDELNDVDHDGRPDLILAYELAGEPVFKRCALPRNNVGYLRHLAHALPDGRFSLDDSAAAAFAKGECPSPPPPQLPSPRQPAELLRAVRCMRLWGVPLEELQARMTQACGKAPAKEPCAGVCGPLLEHLFNYARFNPPLTLHP